MTEVTEAMGVALMDAAIEASGLTSCPDVDKAWSFKFCGRTFRAKASPRENKGVFFLFVQATRIPQRSFAEVRIKWGDPMAYKSPPIKNPRDWTWSHGHEDWNRIPRLRWEMRYVASLPEKAPA